MGASEKQLKHIEMSRGHTDKQLLVKGIKYMALMVLLLILTTYLLTLSFLNTENFMFYVALPLGLIGIVGTIYLGFKGIKTIMNSLFKNS